MAMRLFFISLVIGLFQGLSFAQNNANLATSYTMEACGLNYTQGSVRLNKRNFSFSPQTGVTQPATVTISGLPVCAVVLKAFLYVGTSGTGATFTTTFTNPVSITSNVPMPLIGSDVDVCWGFGGSHTYRADVTSLVTGNGNYVLSGIPTSSTVNVSATDADGATLFVVYQDPAQGYTGGIVLADGCKATTLTSPQYSSITINGFSVCGTPTVTDHFMIVADLQQLGNTLFSFNAPSTASTSGNYNKFLGTDKVWDFVSAQFVSPFVAVQTTANYGMYNFGQDCYSMVAAGTYYRTGCLACQATSGVVSPVITLTPAVTTSCTSAITVNLSGGLPPYTYIWTGGVSTTSVASGLQSGQYNVTVNGAAGCGTASLSIEILSTAPQVISTSASVCAGQSATLTAFGGDYYSWTGPGAFSAVTDAINVTGSNVAGTAVYSVVVTAANGCTASATSVLTTVGDPTVTASATKTLICKGSATTLTPMGAVSYTWMASGISGTAAIIVTPTASTIYSVEGVNSIGCKSAGTIPVSVSECVGIGEDELTEKTLLSVSPNPSSGNAVIHSQLPMTLRLVNSPGQLISVIVLDEKNNYSAGVSGLSSGIYYLIDQQGRTFKMVVK